METIKRQTRAVYGCLVVGQGLWALDLTAVYMLYARSVCDPKVPLQLRYVALLVLCAFALFGLWCAELTAELFIVASLHKTTRRPSHRTHTHTHDHHTHMY